MVNTRIQRAHGRPLERAARRATIGVIVAALSLGACERRAEIRRVTVERALVNEQSVDASRVATNDAAADEAQPDATVVAEVVDGASASETRIPRGWIDESAREANVEQRFANEDDRQQCTPLPSPRLPTVPERLREEVERLRPRARELVRCYNGGYRIARTPDRRCDAWTNELVAAGPAAAHAMGIELTTLKTTRSGAQCGTAFEGSAADRAAFVIARTGGVSAMPYVLRYIAINVPIRGRYEMDRTLSLAFESVYRMALRSLGPPREGVYASETESYHRERLRRWGQWFVLHGAEPREQWQESMLAIQRRRITVTDALTRLIAAQILDGFDGERALVESAIERACREGRTRMSGGGSLPENFDMMAAGRLCDLRRSPFGDPR